MTPIPNLLIKGMEELAGNLAKIMTNIFNAPWVCGYVLLYFLARYHELVELNIIIGVLMFLYLIPWGPVLSYSIVKKINPSKLSASKRIPFIVIGLISYISGAIYFYFIKPRTIISEFLFLMHLMYIIFSSLIIIGNLWSKPSIHVGGFTAPITLLALFDNILIISLLVLAPLIGWTRVRLGIHTLNQLLLGFIIGLLSSVLAYIIGVFLF